MSHHGGMLNRGPEHVHRWQSVCSCGWKSKPLRSKKTARSWLTTHLQRGPVVLERQPVTPQDKLPEALRG